MQLRRVLVPLVIVAGGVFVARSLIASKPEAAQLETEVPITWVEVRVAARTDERVRVTAMGVVKPEQQVVIQPEVSGRVVEQNHALVPGGRLAKGDVLVRIDPRDYSTAVAMNQAELAQARLMAREEDTLRKVAEHEWAGHTEGLSEETLAFTRRQPHLEAASARVSSAKSRIDKARRDLQRTFVRAPFDAIVVDEAVDVGQTVGPQSLVATLAGVERFWVQVSMPVAQLRHLDIPGTNATGDRGSTARVVHELADGTSIEHPGYVVRLLGAVDERGRMAQVMIAVDDPLGLRAPMGERRLPLLMGSYVDVELDGRTLPGVVAVPRAALHDGDRVWIVDDDGRLRARTVEVAWREHDRVLVSSGIAAGERMVVTPLAAPTEGTAVSVAPAAAPETAVAVRTPED